MNRSARHLHRDAQIKHGDDREVAFDALAPAIEELDNILGKLLFHAEEISVAVRREKINVWLTFSAKVAGILVAALTLLKAMLWVMGKVG